MPVVERHAGPSAHFAALHAALTRLPGFGDLAADALEPMRVKGLVHEHIRVRGRGMVLRVPHWSQFGLSPEDNLVYQTACFERAGPCGATPRLHAVIPVSPEVPYGALVVDEIVGRPLRLPGDMTAVADCLAAIHILPTPKPTRRPPLYVHEDAVTGTLAFIRLQSAFLSEAELARDALLQIEEEIDWAQEFAASEKGASQPISLVGTDTHPGNFVLDQGGRAVFVDLEKALYGSPAIDLAHASVYTSTMWEPDSATALSRDETVAFYRNYLDSVPAPLADALRPWLTPLRRLTWLRTTTWCAKWRVESARMSADSETPDKTSSWAARRRDPAMIAAVRARIDDYFDPESIARIRAEWLGPDTLDLSA